MGIIPYGDFDIEEEDALTGIKNFPGHLTNKAGTGKGPSADAGPDEAGCRQREYERLAEHVKKHLDMDRFYAILDGSVSMFCNIREQYPCLYCGGNDIEKDGTFDERRGRQWQSGTPGTDAPRSVPAARIAMYTGGMQSMKRTLRWFIRHHPLTCL